MVVTSTGGAGGDGPVGNGEGVLSFGGGLRVTGEETGKQTVGCRSEGVYGESPTAGSGEVQGTLADQAGRHWSGNF